MKGIMDINSIKIGEAREIAALLGIINQPQSQSHPWQIGKPYFIRTVTHHYTGRLVAVYSNELVLEECAWIADDGRFAQAVDKGEYSEVEPYPKGSRVIIGRSVIEDALVINHELPQSQK
jgi:hypothetical protein